MSSHWETAHLLMATLRLPEGMSRLPHLAIQYSSAIPRMEGASAPYVQPCFLSFPPCACHSLCITKEKKNKPCIGFLSAFTFFFKFNLNLLPAALETVAVLHVVEVNFN